MEQKRAKKSLWDERFWKPCVAFQAIAIVERIAFCFWAVCFTEATKKNETENLQEKQKYLNDYNHEKSVAEIREKKEKNSNIKLEEKLESINSNVVEEEKYTEGLPNYLWSIDSLYKVNVMAKRHLTNYHKSLHSYFEAKKKFNNSIDI